MLRSASGVLGTVEVGNGFPRDGTNGEWKIAGRDAILTMKDGIMKLATAESDETLPGANVTAPAFTALRDALDHWRRGAAPPIGVQRDRPGNSATLGATWRRSVRELCREPMRPRPWLSRLRRRADGLSRWWQTLLTRPRSSSHFPGNLVVEANRRVDILMLLQCGGLVEGITTRLQWGEKGCLIARCGTRYLD